MKSLVVSLLLLPGLALGAPSATCKKSPALTGKCSMVKGSLGMTPEVGVTLNTEDGGRILITAPPDSNADIASNVMQNWLYWQSKTGNISTRISGTYEVCPLPVQPNNAGIAQYACINNGRSITEDKTAR